MTRKFAPGSYGVKFFYFNDRDKQIGVKKNSPINVLFFLVREAAPGFEPGNKGFADLCLSHLAMPPFKERETGFEPATSTLARLHSTAELFPLLR